MMRLLLVEDDAALRQILEKRLAQEGYAVDTYGEDITSFDSLPVREGEFSRARLSDVEWLLLDSKPITVNGEGVRIRVAASCAQIRQTLRIFKALFLIGVPIMTALAVPIGFLIARRSLQPIHRIIACADEIANGDLTRRVPEEQTADELGELTRTPNRMLASLEDSFRRERRFTSDASHELRTPVAVILAYAESLMADTSLPDAQRETVKTILNECRRMRRMIKQMLTLTRAQEGRYPVTMEHICLNDVLNGVQAALEPIAADRSIALHIDAESRIELTADQSLITQLLLNLTENAVKYGKDGGDVWVCALQDDDSAVITVSDNGIGINSENLPHIFDRFFRADAARDRTGTGLGLSIAQWIVQLHGGTIRAESEENIGTRFTVTLPMH